MAVVSGQWAWQSGSTIPRAATALPPARLPAHAFSFACRSSDMALEHLPGEGSSTWERVKCVSVGAGAGVGACDEHE